MFIFVVVATVLGLGALALSRVRSRIALPLGALAMVLGLSILGAGVFYTVLGYREANEVTKFSPHVLDRDLEGQQDSIRMISRRCLYDGVAEGVTPIVCGIIACGVGLRMRRRSH